MAEKKKMSSEYYETRTAMQELLKAQKSSARPFFVFDKNEISVQNECVATTESVVK